MATTFRVKITVRLQTGQCFNVGIKNIMEISGVVRLSSNKSNVVQNQYPTNAKHHQDRFSSKIIDVLHNINQSVLLKEILGLKPKYSPALLKKSKKHFGISS